MNIQKFSAAVSKRYRFDWIIFLILGVESLVYALTNWRDPFGTPGETYTVPSLIVPLIILIPAAFIAYQRYARGKPWSNIAQLTGSQEPRDEREWHILRKASQYAFGTTYLLTFALLTIFMVAPLPSRLGLIHLLLAFAYLQISARDFYAWLLGIR